MRSCSSPAVSFGPMGIFSCNRISPVSISCCNLKVLTPVSFSPFKMAQLIGAAPLYLGSKEPCTFTVPLGGRFHTVSGNMRKATTTCKSGFSALNWAINSGFFNFNGCSMCKPCSWAYCFTADSLSF